MFPCSKKLISALALLVIAGCSDGGGSNPQPPPPPTQPSTPPPPPMPSATIAIEPAEIHEEAIDQGATITLSLSEAADEDVQVQLATGGDAIAGGDYDLEAGEVTIAAGQTSQTLRILPIRDFEEEGTETLEVRIEAVSGGGAEIGDPASASLGILDAGGAPDAKASIAPDLLAFFTDVSIRADGQQLIDVVVLNWGAAPASPSTLLLAVSDQPDWSQLDQDPEAREVPALDPQYGVRFRFAGSVEGSLAPNSHYYLLTQVNEIAEELPNRAFTNQDFWGFSTDADGRVLMRCTPPPQGLAQPGVADPFLDEQWHLVNTGQRAFAENGGRPGEDIGMATALRTGPTGAGVRLAVVDTGLEICHPDLAPNIEAGASHNFNTGDWHGAAADDPFQLSTLGDHGTSIAGIAAAAANNGIGGRGVAPGVLLRGYNYLSANNSQMAFMSSLGGGGDLSGAPDADVFNMSFGGLAREDNVSREEKRLFKLGVEGEKGVQGAEDVEALRQGKGAIFVKAAGNGFNSCGAMRRAVNGEIGCDAANGDATNNLPYLIVVGGFNAAGSKASYASAGANIWISGPAGEFGSTDPALISTDQLGLARGYDNLARRGLALDRQANPHGHYISTINGTSSSTPNVAGAAALLLEAHPELSWRDLKHILASTARQIDPDAPQVRFGIGGAAYVMQLPWITNAAGYHFHNWYGFGALDVDQALEYAASHIPGSLGEFVETEPFPLSESEPPPMLQIPDHHGAGASQALAVSGLPNEARIEAVILQVDITHPFANDLGIHLISPSGTESVLNPAFNDALAGNEDLQWELLSNAFYGEPPNGDWTLKLVDAAAGDAGQLNGWSLRFALGVPQGN